MLPGPVLAMVEAKVSAPRCRTESLLTDNPYSVNVYWLFFLVPGFSFFLSLWNLQPLRSKELPVMVLIAIIGFVTNRLATQYVSLDLVRLTVQSERSPCVVRSSTAPTLSRSSERPLLGC